MASLLVMPDRLAAASAALTDLAGRVSLVGRDAASIPVLQAVFGRLPEAATLYRALETSISRCTAELGEVTQGVERIGAGAKYCARAYARTDANVAESYRRAVWRKANGPTAG